MDTLLGDIDLILADRFPGRNDLAVQVRQADLVIVDEVKCADTTACQCLDGLAAHAADAEHSHARVV